MVIDFQTPEFSTPKDIDRGLRGALCPFLLQPESPWYGAACTIPSCLAYGQELVQAPLSIDLPHNKQFNGILCARVESLNAIQYLNVLMALFGILHGYAVVSVEAKGESPSDDVLDVAWCHDCERPRSEVPEIKISAHFGEVDERQNFFSPCHGLIWVSISRLPSGIPRRTKGVPGMLKWGDFLRGRPGAVARWPGLMGSG